MSNSTEMTKKGTARKPHTPNKYKTLITSDMLLRITAMCRDGARDIDIANYIGISYNTLYEWISKHPEFEEAMRTGKEIIDIQVENALLSRCLGYEYTETKKTWEHGKLVKKESTTKYMPPDVTACCVWLNNRKPDQWKRNRDNYTISETDSGITINIVKAKEKKDKKKSGEGNAEGKE